MPVLMHPVYVNIYKDFTPNMNILLLGPNKKKIIHLNSRSFHYFGSQKEYEKNMKRIIDLCLVLILTSNSKVLLQTLSRELAIKVALKSSELPENSI